MQLPELGLVNFKICTKITGDSFPQRKIFLLSPRKSCSPAGFQHLLLPVCLFLPPSVLLFPTFVWISSIPSSCSVTERGCIRALCPSCFPETLHHLLLSKADSLQLSLSQTWSVLDQSSCLGVWIGIADQSPKAAGSLALEFPKQQAAPQTWSRTQMCGWNLNSAQAEERVGYVVGLTDHGLCETGGQKLPLSDLLSRGSAAYVRVDWMLPVFLSTVLPSFGTLPLL